VDLKRIHVRAGANEDMMLVLESDDIQAPEMTVEELPISVCISARQVSL
jgi:hypothetical protein